MNLIDIAKQFATEEACVNYLEAMRWPEGVRCLKCDGANVSKYHTSETSREVKNRKTGEMETKRVPARFIYQCMDKACHFQFSVTTGTIFNDSHLGLEKWFNAVALMCNAKKGISAMEMQRDLKTAYKTAWYLNHRIRKAMMMADLAFNAEPLTGVLEADETFIGSKKYDARRKRARYDKEPVFGIVQRGGKARTYHMRPLNRWQVAEKLKGDVSIDAKALYTDDGRFYQRVPENIQKHEIVNHSEKEWVRGDVHTGTIDGYWGLLKRGIIGSFHKVSIKHLHRYLSEFQFRWNNREAQDMFQLVIVALVIGTALPYAKLTEKASQPEVSEPFEDVPF